MFLNFNILYYFFNVIILYYIIYIYHIYHIIFNIPHEQIQINYILQSYKITARSQTRVSPRRHTDFRSFMIQLFALLVIISRNRSCKGFLKTIVANWSYVYRIKVEWLFTKPRSFNNMINFIRDKFDELETYWTYSIDHLCFCATV